MGMNDILNEIKAEFSKLTWQHTVVQGPDNKSADGYIGGSPDWHVVVVKFKVPDGRTGYDGACTALKRGMVVHLPPQMAEEAVKAAEAALLH